MMFWCSKQVHHGGQNTLLMALRASTSKPQSLGTLVLKLKLFHVCVCVTFVIAACQNMCVCVCVCVCVVGRLDKPAQSLA